MRVKLGKRIHFCTLATLPDDSKLILLTTNNGIYTVNMNSFKEARDAHRLMLVNGYYDFSEYEYSN